MKNLLVMILEYNFKVYIYNLHASINAKSSLFSKIKIVKKKRDKVYRLILTAECL